jgi:hypothetical protein
MKANFHPTKFIHVPTTIETWTQIQQVIHQTQSLDTPQMHQWRQQFGPINKEEAFAYLLGIIVSDCGKSSITHSSHRIDLRLSKKYSWSKQLGEATCYYLGLISIHAKQVGDRDSLVGPNTCYSWNSENTPLLQWIDKTCFGLEIHQRTTHDSIKADWLLKAPTNIRIKFLQGLNDGDGSASIKDQTLSNTCGPNIPFLRKFLQTFDIGSTQDEHRIKIKRQICVLHAAKLPFFLHATDRQMNADKLAEMIRVRREENPRFIPQEVIAEVHQLNRQGLSKGRIAELIFDKFRVSYDRRRIAYILKKYPQDNSNQ